MKVEDESMESLSDSVLVERARDGDMSAWEDLISRHERRVYSLAMRMLRQVQDAEDVTQQTFLSIMEHLDGFRGESQFSTWVLRIATNAALKVIRKRKGLPTCSLDDSGPDDRGFEGVPHPKYIADWKDVPEEVAQTHETRRILDEALDELDEKYRIVFLLRDAEGLSVRETAETLGISEANTKVRLLRARLQLREKLTRLFGDPATVFEPSRHHG
jgi:RNA polymerase sigma-70 factor (ECF subfamily)